MRLASIIIAFFLIAAPAKAQQSDLEKVEADVSYCARLDMLSHTGNPEIVRKCVEMHIAIGINLYNHTFDAYEPGDAPGVMRTTCIKLSVDFAKNFIAYYRVFNRTHPLMDYARGLQTQCETMTGLRVGLNN